jgi:hypothetical protein
MNMLWRAILAAWYRMNTSPKLMRRWCDRCEQYSQHHPQRGCICCAQEDSAW